MASKSYETATVRKYFDRVVNLVFKIEEMTCYKKLLGNTNIG